jgi:hypothetical protein
MLICTRARYATPDWDTSTPASLNKSSTPTLGLHEEWANHATAVFTGLSVGYNLMNSRSSILHHLYNAYSYDTINSNINRWSLRPVHLSDILILPICSYDSQLIVEYKGLQSEFLFV